MESGGFEDIPKIFSLTWNSDNVMQVMIIRSELMTNKTETDIRISLLVGVWCHLTGV